MLRHVFLTSTMASVAAFAAFAAFAQTPPPPAFEVASIKPSPGGKAGEGLKRDMRTGAAVQVSPDGVTIRSSSLRQILCWAHKMFDYQVIGPDWLGSERFDIVAKAAGPVDADQLHTMLQTLLTDRFKMTTHRQTKEMNAYVLQIAKSGFKARESTSGDGDMEIAPNQQRMQVVVKRAGVPQLIDALSNIFKAPVVDETGLTGRYDVTLDMMKYLADMKPSETGAPPDPQAIILRGIQEELGLKMEPKKMQVEQLVIDKAEKVPSAN